MAKTEESEQITLEDNVYKNHTIIAKYEAVLVSAEPMGWRAQVGYFKTDKDGKPVSEKRTIDVVL
ncbi:hypothetical protein KY311_03930, partial [Candidatus Woesearchaeota archaeon]|nr:hypothetical protein [Candidatus Woesearchaeota archaeon]